MTPVTYIVNDTGDIRGSESLVAKQFTRSCHGLRLSSRQFRLLPDCAQMRARHNDSTEGFGNA